jgi:CheY-like chemotaxis protein
MKIACVSPLMESVPPQLYGGTERIVAYLCDELIEFGHYLRRLTRTSVRTEVGEAQPAKRDLGGVETVLIVEDNELVRNTMATMTEGLGYRVLTAAGAAEALELIDGGALVDILISDIVMAGGLNGLELADKVRPLSPGLPILLMSGYPAATADDGGYPTLHKPFSQRRTGAPDPRCFNSRTSAPRTK